MALSNIKPFPFDSLCLAAIVAEIRPSVGGRLQRVIQPNERTLFLGIYANGVEQGLLLSCSPNFARAHPTSVRPASTGDILPLAAALRRDVDGGRVTQIRQVGFDRILEVEFTKAEGAFRLVAELTGKHSNLILVDPAGKVVAAAHRVTATQSVRPVMAQRPYSPPPFPPRRPIFEAKNWEEFDVAEGGGPFLKSLLLARAGLDRAERTPGAFEALKSELSRIKQIVRSGEFQPVSVPNLGAYPISVAALGLEERASDDFGRSVDVAFRTRESAAECEALRAQVLAPLRRVLLAREVALEELKQARETARNAGQIQLMGELILAYAHQIQEGQAELVTQDYEGNPLTIRLDPELSPIQNANLFFDKAKRAKGRSDFVREQIDRIDKERVSLLAAVRKAEDAQTSEPLHEILSQARERRWLIENVGAAKTADERPYEGHRIRERTGPGGVKVLYGENATSNDYLTQRVARPNDIWLHVRGATSSHVVIPTANRPERIGPEALRFAAEIAVANSTSKHSGYVSVDWTLKKYVRKPRGAKAGTVTYSHEKTIAVEKRT